MKKKSVKETAPCGMVWFLTSSYPEERIGNNHRQVKSSEKILEFALIAFPKAVFDWRTAKTGYLP